MAVLSVSSLVINPANPSVMFAGTGEGYGNADSLRGAGIFKSVDGGTTWTQLPGTAEQSSAVTRLAISPNGTVVLVGTNTGLWRSTNASTFTWIDAGVAPQDVDINPSDGRKAVVAGYGAIAYSWDGGLTWRRSTGLPSTSGRIELAYARSQPDTIYALVDDDGGMLFRSGNAGATFSAVSTTPLLDNGQGWYDEALWVNPRDSNHVVAGGVFLRQTFDGGSTWRWISDNIHVDQHVIVEDPRFDDAGNRTVFIGNDGGVYKTTNIRNVEADGYTALNNNLGVTQFYGGAGNAASGTIVGGTQDNGTVFNEPRQGTRWKQSLGSDGGFVASDPTDPSYFYSEMIYLQIHRSDDGGAAWTSITNGLADAFQNANFIAPFVLDPNDPNRMLAGGSRLWRSTNIKSGSPAWTPITGSKGTNYVSAIAVAPGQSDVVWVAHNMGQVYRSTNGTAAKPSFSQVNAPTLGNFVSRVAISAVDPNVVYVATGSFGSTNVIKTVNGGASWGNATGSGATGLPDVPVNDLEIDPSNPDTIYAGTEVGVFVSQDGGATWDLPQDGPANVSVDELFWMGATLVAATHGRGMFAADSSGAAPPKAAAAPPLLDFGSVAVSSRSAPRRVTIDNSGGLPLTIYSLSIDGPHVDYAIAGSTCSGTLPLGGTCWVEMTFGPRAEGQRIASLNLVSNASNSELAIPLRGAGVGATAPKPLPAPWTSADVGAVGKTGSASASAGTFTIDGAGADIWGASDAFHFAYIQLPGDGTIVARVATVQNVAAWTKAGVMIRQSLAADAAHASLFVTPAKGVAFQRRAAAGGTSTSTAVAGAAPRFVKLKRAGNVITASVSIDRLSWTKVGQQAIAIGGPVLAGLAVSSHDATRLASVTFDHTAIFDASTLPAGWRSEDVGAAGVAGSASAASGVFTVHGSGADIWGAADAFHFAHRTLRGDGELVARVAQVQNTHRWAKAGVMIRQATSASSAFAMMVVSAASGAAFQYPDDGRRIRRKRRRHGGRRAAVGEDRAGRAGDLRLSVQRRSQLAAGGNRDDRDGRVNRSRARSHQSRQHDAEQGDVRSRPPVTAVHSYATFQPSPRSEFISSTDRSISTVGSSTSSTDSLPSG